MRAICRLSTAAARFAVPLSFTYQRRLKIADPLKTHDFRNTISGKKAQHYRQKTLASKHTPTATPTSFPECILYLDLTFQKIRSPNLICPKVTFKTTPALNLRNLTKPFQATTGIKATLLRRRVLMHSPKTTRFMA